MSINKKVRDKYEFDRSLTSYPQKLIKKLNLL